ncbi:hypothetical protein LRS56_06045 [Pseudomonas poae]|nr:hypothetical protein LRS56_06045 [Pseudomonas poae]
MTETRASPSPREGQRAVFLTRVVFAQAQLVALPTDASMRRYFRLSGEGLLLMDSPPHSEPIRPFMQVARHLPRLGLFCAGAGAG